VENALVADLAVDDVAEQPPASPSNLINCICSIELASIRIFRWTKALLRVANCD
jgi:hypothetical protein